MPLNKKMPFLTAMPRPPYSPEELIRSALRFGLDEFLMDSTLGHGKQDVALSRADYEEMRRYSGGCAVETDQGACRSDPYWISPKALRELADRMEKVPPLSPVNKLRLIVRILGNHDCGLYCNFGNLHVSNHP